MQIQLKTEIIDRIKKDAILCGEIAATLKMSIFSLPKIIYENDAKLTQASVLRLIRKRFSIKKDSDLLTETLKATA